MKEVEYDHKIEANDQRPVKEVIDEMIMEYVDEQPAEFKQRDPKD